MSTTRPFQHQDLDDSENQIRLFQLSYDDKAPLICCQIKTFELNTCPEFIAISYMWGPPEPRKAIVVNDAEFEVRQNLWDLLLTLRLEEPNEMSVDDTVLSSIDRESAYFWCDQLCIDQLTVRERNHQVSLMGRIYSTAIETLVWLGQDVDAHSMDIALNKPGGQTWRHYYKETKEGKLLSAIYGSQYWLRLWIVQEVWFSKKINIICSDGILSWSNLSELVMPPSWQNLSSRQVFEQRHNIVPQTLRELISLKKLGSSIGEQRLSYVIESFGHLQCADPRDKVFGLLGLLPRSQRVNVDYSLSVHELFVQVLNKVVTDEQWMSYESHLDFATELADRLQCHDKDLEQISDVIAELQQKSAARMADLLEAVKPTRTAAPVDAVMDVSEKTREEQHEDSTVEETVKSSTNMN